VREVKNMTFGEKLVQLRKISGMTQEQLAEKLNVSRQTVSKWENDMSEADWSAAVKISRTFNISLDELADNTAEDDKAEEKSGLLLEDMAKINNHNRKMTMLFMLSTELIVICILAAIVISIINDATLTIQYMLYRYIAVGDYNNVMFADYSISYIFAAVSGILGIIGFAVYCIENRVKK